MDSKVVVKDTCEDTGEVRALIQIKCKLSDTPTTSDGGENLSGRENSKEKFPSAS